MGTERILTCDAPCSCGEGTYKVFHCSPDHPWAKASDYWYEYKINCDVCSKLYELNYEGGKLYLIKKAAIKEKEEIKEEYFKKSKQAIEFAREKGYLDQLSIKIDSMPSIAAIYRLLSEYIFVHGTESTFRKHFNSYHSSKLWIEANIQYSDLPGILNLIDVIDDDLVEIVSDVESLYKKTKVPIEKIEYDV